VPTLQRPNISRRPSTSSSNLAVPWPCTPDLTPRPQSSRANFPFAQGLGIGAAHEPEPREEGHDEAEADTDLSDMDLDSDWSLPLQGTRDSAWAYLYESKGGYLINPPPLPTSHSISPISSTSPLLPHATRNRTSTFEDTVLSRGTSPHLSLSHKRSESLLTQMRNRTPTFEDASHIRSVSQTRNRTPTFDDARSPAGHKKSSSLDFMTRLSGDSLLESSEEVRERARNNKKKSWGSLGVGVNAAMARFSKGQGIREII
jgi:hypothetical protein